MKVSALLLALFSSSAAFPICTEQQLEEFQTCEALDKYMDDLFNCITEEQRTHFCNAPSCESLVSSARALVDVSPECAIEGDESRSIKMEVTEAAENMEKTWAEECTSSLRTHEFDENASLSSLAFSMHE